MRRFLAIGVLGVALATPRTRAAAQAVHVRVLDSASGAPVRRAHVLIAGRWYGRGDSTGLVRVERVLPLARAAWIFCRPVSGFGGGPGAGRALELSTEWPDTLVVHLDGTRCDQRARVEPTVSLVGGIEYYHHGPRFLPCRESARALPAPFHLIGDDTIWVALTALPIPRPPRPTADVAPVAVDTVRGVQRRYLRVYGRVVGPGRYGERGLARFHIELDSSSAWLPERSAGCRSP